MMKEPEECSWSREAILSVIHKAAEGNEGPLDKATIVKRCNAMFQGKRKKVSDNLAQNYLNHMVRTGQLKVVFPTPKKTPFYALVEQSQVASSGEPPKPRELLAGVFVVDRNHFQREDPSFTHFLFISNHPAIGEEPSPGEGGSSNLKLLYGELLEHFVVTADKAAEFLNDVISRSEKYKVLIISSDGSAAAAVIIAFFMKHRKLAFPNAYNTVVSSGFAPAISSIFVRRLIEYANTLPLTLLAGTSINPWDEIQTETKTFQDWLILNNKLGKRNYEDAQPTHLLWSVKTKPHYHIPSDRMPEFFSEYAKAYLRGEQLLVVEYRSDESPLFVDLDIKCSLPDVNSAPRKELILELFLQGMSNAIVKFLTSTGTLSLDEDRATDEGHFSEKEEGKKGADHSEPMIALSGVGTTFSHAHYPTVNYKYGFHVIFTNVVVNAHQRKKFSSFLHSEFTRFWPDPSEDEPIASKRKLTIQAGKGEAIPSYIYENNKLTEIFDHPENLRMLYSAKMMKCKKCKPKKQVQKKHQGKNRGQGVANRLHRECGECQGTGLRNPRIYEFMGIYSCSKKQWDNGGASLGGDVEGIRRKVELCSLRNFDPIKR